MREMQTCMREMQVKTGVGIRSGLDARDADLRLLVARQLGRGRVERHRLRSGGVCRASVSVRVNARVGMRGDA